MLGDALLLPGEIYLGFIFKPVFSCTVHRFIAEFSFSASSSVAPSLYLRVILVIGLSF